ncbi:MAG TPA: class E sortase [Acidimicrobiales bacterium]|nr:class E sortase [Acidimicrobiales bacterium]
MALPRMSRRVAQVVGGVGRTLIGVGLVLLLFVGYQLWGTGIQQARAQDRLEDEFAERLAEVGDAPTTTVAPTTVPPPTTSGPSTTAPTTTVAPTTTTIDPEVLAALAPVNGDPIARIRMPTIGVDQTVVYGVGVSDLKLGPGHFPSTPLPGQAGNAAIAGHRTTYGQPFHDIDQLRPGDPIIVDTLQGSFTYRVMAHPDPDDESVELGHFIVPPTAVEVLDDFGDNRLTLSACHPKFSSRQRIIVTALLEEEIEPAPPTPTTVPPIVELPDEDGSDDDGDDIELAAPVDEGFGEGLGGDPDALGPAVVWGVLAAGVLLCGWLLGQRWRRWPVYALTTPVFLAVLFACFFYVDLLLPAY